MQRLDAKNPDNQKTIVQQGHQEETKPVTRYQEGKM
jgi:hypothetical protein